MYFFMLTQAYPTKNFKAYSIEPNMQATLLDKVHLKGVGVHSGREIQLTLNPAVENTGIVFERTDVQGSNQIEAIFNRVSDTKMSTSISNQDGVTVSTIEHLMAALSGLGVTNCLVQVSGPEIPILDGSSLQFCQAILAKGVSYQNEKARSIDVLKTIRVEQGKSWAELRPATTRQFHVEFDFGARIPAKLKQSPVVSFDQDQQAFHQVLSHARTFGLYEDAEKIQSLGLAKGAGLHNTIIIKDEGILNEDGLRHPDEFAQHKILDAMGDLALSSFRIVGAYHAYNGSHSLNNQLVRKLFMTPNAWGWSDSDFCH